MADNTRSLASGCFMLIGMALGLVLVALTGVLGFCLGAGVFGVELSHGPGVAVLDIYSEIDSEYPILAQLEELVNNPDTQALVVRVDSPGGVITAVEEVFNALQRVANEDIPVVASMGSTAASGGYFICLAAERVFANKGTLTGSIGVLVEYSSAQDLFEKIGIEFETIKSGEFKGAGMLSERLTERQRDHIEHVVQDYHALFVEALCEARGFAEEDARAFADGRMFTGRQALKAGLVDEIGDLHAAVNYAASLAGLESDPPIIRAPAEHTLDLGRLVDQLGLPVTGSLSRRSYAPKFVMR